jgi:hypothetical protein
VVPVIFLVLPVTILFALCLIPEYSTARDETWACHVRGGQVVVRRASWDMPQGQRADEFTIGLSKAQRTGSASHLR